MKSTVKVLESAKMEMTVVIPSADVETMVAKQLKKLGKKAKFNGFRAGKAPMSMLKAAYGEQARGEALNEILNDSYPKAISENDLRPIDQGSIENVDHEPGGDLTYTAVLEVEPAIEIKDYKGLAVQRSKREVSPADLDRALDGLRKQYATWTPVEEGGAVLDDQMVCDIQECDEKGEALAEHLYKGIQVELGKAQYGPAFDEKMLGVAVDEVRSLDVPDPDDESKIEHYSVTVHEIKRAEMADLDDEFAKEVPPGFDTLDALKEKVNEDLGVQLLKALDTQVNNRLIEMVIEKNPIEIPQKMIDNQLDGIIEQAKSNTDNPIDDTIVRDSYREQVTNNLHWGLLARSIVKIEDIKVEEADLDQEIARFAQSMGQDPKAARLQLKRFGGLERLEAEALDRKLLDYLRSVSVIEEVDEPETSTTDSE